VALVGHSTGGLIGRLVVEDPKLDPSNVKVLIQIGTPNQGSVLAGLPLALEWTRVFWDREANGSVHRVLGTLRQSLANALDGTGRDLMPDSDLLTLAASRPRNRNVVYHSVLGTRSLLTSEQAESVRKWASVQLAGSSFGRTLKPKVERWLDNPDELIDGRGDGAVSVASGRLEGVEAVLVALDHYGLIRRNGVLSRTPYGEDHPVFTYVKSWLSEIR
jgi:hypothetical protein